MEWQRQKTAVGFPMPRQYYVSLSDNPGPFVEEDGPEKGVIVTEVTDIEKVPKMATEFAVACSEFQLGCPRVSRVLPYLNPFNPAGWRSVSIGNQIYWTNLEPNAFPVS
jgi:hypothetical protein